MNAIELLKKDHRTVESLFESFEKAKENDKETSKAELFASIKEELDAHAKVEEEIFYPAFDRAAEKDDDKELVLEAGEEHKQVKTLLAELEGLDPDDETFDAKMKVLKDNVEHHVKEEEGEMFPHAQKELGSDELEQLGQRIAARKEQLQGQPGRPEVLKASGRQAPGSRARAASPTRRSGRAPNPASGSVRASDGSGGELLEAMGSDESAVSGSSRTPRRSSRGGARSASSGSSSSRSSRSRSSSSGSSRSRSGSSGSRSRSSSSGRSTGARRSSASRRPSGSSGRGASSRGRSSSRSRGRSSSRSRGSARGRGRSTRG